MAAVRVKLVKSLIGRSKRQVDVARSLGLKKIGDEVSQPDNFATRGKIKKIFHLVELV